LKQVTQLAEEKMLEVSDALKLVRQTAQTLPPLTVPLPAALRCLLAESITSDVDSPPHDKSIVDGYAVAASDCVKLPVTLEVIEEVSAGKVPTRSLAPGKATRVMTGAPIPSGCAAVVMVEETTPAGDNAITINAARVRAGQNIVRRASSMAQGEEVLSPGVMLRSIELGLLAEVGRSAVSVVPSPRVAILPTGNELVPFTSKPAPGFIRNSNGPMLAALVKEAGCEAIELEVARDEVAELREHCDQGLDADVLILSGGVSMGAYDLVPGTLADLGVAQVFHKVNLKPGKPLWFGVREASSLDAASSRSRRTLVFGLPGNPVSSLVCFMLFVRPALAWLAGRNDGDLMRGLLYLDHDFHYRGGRASYVPASLIKAYDGKHRASLVPYSGSGDLRALARSQALLSFSGGPQLFPAGSPVEALLL
jgi:molybdopterin molybdotransferase